MRKFMTFLIALSVFIGMFSVISVNAYQSEAMNKETGQPRSQEQLSVMPDAVPDTLRKEGYFVVDSITMMQETKNGPQNALEGLKGLKLDYSSQKGELPINSFVLSLGETDLFSYSIQKTVPYLIKCNFLGSSAYKIDPSDKFEEKLTAAFYSLMDSMSSMTGVDSSQLPDINGIYGIISVIRTGLDALSEKPEETSITDIAAGIDAGSLENVFLNIITRFSETEPTETIAYLYSDIAPELRKYEWPAETGLPAYPVPVSALTAAFTSTDFIDLLNAMPQFFEDNPALKDYLNLAIKQGLKLSNPEMAASENTDYLGLLISELINSFETEYKDFRLTVRIDLDENQNPVAYTFVPAGSTGTLFTVTYQVNSNELYNVYEISYFSDSKGSSSGSKNNGFRLLCVKESEDENTSSTDLQFILISTGKNVLEYTQKSSGYKASTMTKVDEYDIRFALDDQDGMIRIFLVKKPNEFGTDDVSHQTVFALNANGEPLLDLSLSGESKSTAPLAEFPANGIINASEMTEEDYNNAASAIFMQIVMLTMNFTN